jgi:hypothetical protein
VLGSSAFANPYGLGDVVIKEVDLGSCVILPDLSNITLEDLDLVEVEGNKAVSQQEAEDAAARCDGSIGRALQLLEEPSVGNLDDVAVDEYFNSLSDPSWRKEGRLRAIEVVRRLTVDAQARLEKGDISQSDALAALFYARKQLDRYAPARLVLESLFVKLRPVFK